MMHCGKIHAPSRLSKYLKKSQFHGYLEGVSTNKLLVHKPINVVNPRIWGYIEN